MNVLDAIADPKIFAPAFRKPETWAAWRSFLSALFALPMDKQQLAIYRECTGRGAPPIEQSNEAWLVCGRRSGKSFTLALIAVFLAAFKDWGPYLNIGERGTIMIVAADRKQAKVILRYCKGLLGQVPMLSRLVENERQDGVDLTNRLSIEVHSCSFRSTRGYTVVAALLDEVSVWRGEDAAAPDIEVLAAIRPAMATVHGAMLLVASSPYARKGVLWENYHRYFGQAGDPLIWQAATRVMNPTVSETFIAQEMEKDSASAQAEYMAEFRVDIEAYVSREAVEAVTEWGTSERGYVSGIRYVGFVDPSGGSSDAMTLAIAHKEGDIGILDAIREIKPPFSPESVVKEFADLLRCYKITKIRGDRYAGQWPADQFKNHGIRYEPSRDPKGAIYLQFLPLLNSAKVRLLGSKRLTSQLISLERNAARGGRDSIDHARGAHDDIANASAGALLEAMVRAPRMRMGTIDLVKTGRVTWQGEEPVRRLRIVRVDEKGRPLP